METRTILHCDLNNYFASVESLRQPSYRNVPMIVGGNAADRHGIVSDEQDPLEYDFLSFSDTSPQLRSELEALMLSHREPNDRIIRDGTVAAAVRNVTHELNNGDEFSSKLLQNLCEQLIICLIRDFRPVDSHPQALEVSNAEALCYELMNYIDNHVLSLRSLTEMAEHFSYNYSYLSDLFRRTTGQSLTEYHRYRRLDIAARLIREEKLTVTAIADRLGYATVYAFSRAFKARYGVSPAAYRREDVKMTPETPEVYS